MKLVRFVLVAALGVILAAPAMAQATAPSPSRPSATVPPAGMQPQGTQRQGGLVDINSASPQELDSLPGIGTARAQAIIANRPYRSKDELAQRKILPPNVYAQIKDRIIARQGTPSGGLGSTSPSGGMVRPPAEMPQKSR